MKKQSLIIALLTGFLAFSQQDSQFTQYVYNTVSFNPGYTGSRGVPTLTGMYRNQWMGMEGAPVTQSFNFHGPVGERVGTGLMVMHDKIGPVRETYIDGLFSYNIRLKRGGNLSFGLKGGLHFFNVDYSRLANYEDDPEMINKYWNKKVSPNFGVGMYYYTDDFYVGISLPNILETRHFDGESVSQAKEMKNFYLMSGYVFEIEPDWHLKPSLLLKWVRGAPMQLDVAATAWFRKRFSLGASYRWDAAYSILSGFQLTENLLVGLSYDKEVTDLGNTQYNDGSLEVLLRFDMFRGRGYQSQRLF